MPQVHRRITVGRDAGAVLAAVHELLPDLGLTTPSGDDTAHTGAGLILEGVDSQIPLGDARLRIEIRGTDHGSEVTVASAVWLRIPFFTWAFRPVVALTQRRRLRYLAELIPAHLESRPLPAAPRALPGVPTTRFDDEQAALLAAAALAAAVASFGVGLFGQQADFVSDSFGTTDATLGRALALSRLGVVVSVFATAAADRRGRRLLLLVTVSGVAIANIGSALAPNIETFSFFQILVRGFANSVFAVAGVSAIEEAPEGARGFSTAMIALAGGLGFSFAIASLPFSDLGDDAWRISFAVSGATVLALPRLARVMPESRRYRAIVSARIERGQLKELLTPRLRRLLLLLGALGLFGNLFNAPSSQLMNKYLSDDHGFSGFDIAVFRAVTTSLTGLAGLLVASRLMELRGRKPVGGVGLVTGQAIQIVFFLAGGVLLWVSSAGSMFFSAAGGIALGALSAEVFPTEVRATSGAILTLIAVIGSAIGLLIAGELSDPLDSLGTAIALLGIPAVVSIVLIVPRLPEPAGRRLDDVSPPAAPPPEF